METNEQQRTYLTHAQVYALNEKHGWFMYEDAQGDVSRAFAQDAIAMHERMRAAAPELLGSLQEVTERLSELVEEIGGCDHSVGICWCGEKRAIANALAAIREATGAA